jgi:pantoate--beta-alanine ligase
VIEAVRDVIAQEPLVQPEYVEVVDYDTMQPARELRGQTLIALAARVGKARLIDNLLLDLE